MPVSKEVIYKKIEQILDEIDFRDQKSLELIRDLDLLGEHEIEENRFELYETIYSSLEGLEKEICVCFHSELNRLFSFMNKKSKTNKNYNANESRELIKILEKISESQKLFLKIGKEIYIDDLYQKQIKYVSNFLVSSGGSIIPEDYQQIEIIDIEPIFFIKDANSIIKIHNQHKITREFANEQLDKIRKKLDENDFDGVITNVRSLIENVLNEIYKELTGLDEKNSKEITMDFAKIKKELNLDKIYEIDKELNNIVSGLEKILGGIAAISNKMADRHNRKFKPEKRHAQLIVNSAFTFISFIYDVLEYQKSRIDELKKEIDNLNPKIRFEEESILLQKPEVVNFLAKSDRYLKRKVLEYLIDSVKITSYRECDLFIMKLRILSEVIEKEQIIEIKNKFENNNQAVGLQSFLKEFNK